MFDTTWAASSCIQADVLGPYQSQVNSLQSPVTWGSSYHCQPITSQALQIPQSVIPPSSLFLTLSNVSLVWPLGPSRRATYEFCKSLNVKLQIKYRSSMVGGWLAMKGWCYVCAWRKISDKAPRKLQNCVKVPHINTISTTETRPCGYRWAPWQTRLTAIAKVMIFVSKRQKRNWLASQHFVYEITDDRAAFYFGLAVLLFFHLDWWQVCLISVSNPCDCFGLQFQSSVITPCQHILSLLFMLREDFANEYAEKQILFLIGIQNHIYSIFLKPRENWTNLPYFLS